MGEEEDKSFILYVNKEQFHKLFPNRATKIFGSDGITRQLDIIPIPKDLIVCDGCNTDMSEEEIIPLFMLDTEMCYGVECKRCIDKYFSTLPKVIMGK